MQPKINFNTEKHANLHMNVYDVCPKCGQHSLAVEASKKDGSKCKNTFCGYRSMGRNSRRRWNA
jgi:hypothetical protein